MNSHLYGQLIYDKRYKNIQWRKDSLFNKWCWENWITTGKIIKPDCFLKTCTNINSKWIKKLNVRHETIKLLPKNHSQMLLDIGLSNILYIYTHPQAVETKAKINRCDYIKVKRFCTLKKTVKKGKDSLLNARRYL